MKEKRSRKERSDGAETREAIVSAAAEEFADKGFELASAREICRRAGVNSALLSRYFGSKQGLYAEVCRMLFNGLGVPLAELYRNAGTKNECRLAIREWIGRAIKITSASRAPASFVAGIFRHEMNSPSSMHEYLRKEFLSPVFKCFRRLIEAAGSKSEEMTLSLLSSVWSQISIYALLAEVWQRPFRPTGIPKPQWIELIADEIAAGVFARLDRKAD